MRILLIIFLLLPIMVFAQQNADLSVSIDSDTFSDLFFEVPQGSVHNIGIVVENVSDKKQEGRIFVRSANDTQDTESLVDQTRFFDGSLPQDFQNLIENNDHNVSVFCSKADIDEDVQKWCGGLREMTFVLNPKESLRIPVIIAFSSQEKDHRAYLVIEQKSDDGVNYQVIAQREMIYHMPGKESILLDLTDFGLEKVFSPFNLGAFFAAGTKEQHQAHFGVKNIGAEAANFTYYANVRSIWVNESVNFEESDRIVKDQELSEKLILTVPRFGKVSITGGLKYIDENGIMQETVSDPVELFVWPATLLILLLVGICFCIISVLLYTYIRKNMFGRKKKKKESDLFTGEYVVRDADNIISIAQRYGVPWKELAKHNGIEPPYILISGEVIHVPSDVEHADGDTKVDTVQEPKKKSVVDIAQEQIVQATGESEEKTNGGLDSINPSPIQPVQSRAVQDETMQKMSTDVPKESVPEPKEHVSKKAKRKITFASPQNMLTQPSSEPTTRAIDIEWMRDDEAAYMEEMEVQEKQTNKRFIIVLIVVILIVGGVLWWGIDKMMQKDDSERVSVATLIEQEPVEEQNNSVEEAAMADDTTEDQIVQEDKNISEESTEEKSEVSATTDVVVQVLNAGAQTGVAGTVSSILEEEGYTVKEPKNAQNNYSGVVIYYDNAHKDLIEQIASKIDEMYGAQKTEESNDVTQKYDAHVVIVLGS